MPVSAQPPRPAVVEAVRIALAEDLLPLGDLTSTLIEPRFVTTAVFRARHPGVLAGTACATETFAQVDPQVQLSWERDDGDPVLAGQVIGAVRGPLRSVLTGERVALNFLGHLSGIATSTARFVEAAGGRVTIWDTRKTTPGLRALEKAAVRAGGGANHRGSLSDWVMLKDNHLTRLGVAGGVYEARRTWPGRTIHVECDTTTHVAEALAAGADALLLDNMSPAGVREAMALVERHPHKRPLVEVSGGVTLETVADYAATGVDCISVGALTNAAGVLDIGLDIDEGV